MSRLDPHSYADDTQPRTRSFDWSASVDFTARVLRGDITLRFAAPAAGGALDLDTRGLVIESVTGEGDVALGHTLHEADPILGSRLAIALPAGATSVRIRYATTPAASALQWLTPAQTLGKQHPYLFSQCQAIHARSVVPCQDTPSIRQTFTAALDVPEELRAVMAAASLGRETHGDRAIERFEMPQPIPPYLLAFAVGDLASKDLSPRSRVWSEPAQLEAAAWEFAGVEDHLHAAEALFGPYDWDRYDLLVMPPSFPYGGMENPRLTFLTPSLLAGDRSLVSVLAHELAHSWTGNLVTNANAEHFWLNEGFTVFAERRILEALEGPELTQLHAAMGYERLLQAFAQHEGAPELTKLRTHLEGVDPDESFSQVPYEKGYFFLKTLEEAAGREPFDRLLSTWLRTHRFGAATTDDFTRLVEQEIPGLLAKVDAAAWIDGPGLPAGFRKPESARLSAVRSIGGRVPTAAEVETWSVVEWVLYLETMPRPVSAATCAELDARYRLTEAKNPEVLVSWLVLACEAGYAAVLPRAEQLLGHFGRMKYLKPLYKALSDHPDTRDLARALFERFGSSYHPIAQQVVRGLLRDSR
ncbi:MAG: Aminopeptidase [Labilithrix sp.]|nr:Aminopeptidase [Labilithrix sp.]